MKGVILAGGGGSRLRPASNVTNKILLPVYNKPMIFYPLEAMTKAGFKQLMIVAGKEHAGHFLNLLGSGEQFGIRLFFVVQEERRGIAHALSLCEDYVGDDKVVVMLGDNIFGEDITPYVREFEQQNDSARLLLTEHTEPHRFGVAEITDGKLINIEEKPASPKSNLIVTGLYMYPAGVFSVIKTLTPSARGEYEITDVNNHYVKSGRAQCSIIKGFWSDAGTPESLFRASEHIRRHATTNTRI